MWCSRSGFSGEWEKLSFLLLKKDVYQYHTVVVLILVKDGHNNILFDSTLGSIS